MSSSLVNSVRGLQCANVNIVGPVLTCSRGFKAVVANGPGDHTLEMQQALDIQNDGGGIALVQVYGAVPGSTSLEQVDPTHLRVRILDTAGAPLNTNFSVYLQPVGPS